MEIQNFEKTHWCTEYQRFENNPEYARQKTEQELFNLVGRVLGEKWKDAFSFQQKDIHSKNGNDAWEIFEEGGKIVISGPNGVSMGAGLRYYLKKYAHVNFNPLFGSNVKMPEQLPHFLGRIHRETQYSVRYALNFCTYGYTMAFWGWKEYEALLDWFALNGVNLMLDIVGQEEVQRQMLAKLGYQDEEIRRYIPGPAYLPWFFMQNMSGFGGPLPEEWFGQRVELARRMHDRMQALGIRPLLQGYAGMVPQDFAKKHPDAAVVEQGLWCGFTRPAMLRVYDCPGKDYFDLAASIFYEKQREVFGPVSHYYAVDPFHEGGNMGDMEPGAVYNTIQRKMLEQDPQAIWLLMQWQGQISDEKISGLCQPEQALVLDLQADRRSFCEVMERHEVPWVWSMVHNFGGRMGVDGDVVTLAQEIPAAFEKHVYMKGIGAAPEAFNSGPIMYDLLFDMAWEDGPVDCKEYVREYAKSRYGGIDSHLEKAWDILLHTAYWKKSTYAQGAGESVINARPAETFRSASTWGHSDFEYEPKELEQALLEFLAAYDNYGQSETFRYDLVDLAKQILSNTANSYYRRMMEAYFANNLPRFQKISQKFLELIQFEDEILSCCPAFCMEPWIASARNVMGNADETVKDLMEFNARALISTWGSFQNSEGCLLDYSNRQWAGFLKSYALPRWENFVGRYTKSLQTGRKPEPFSYFDMEWEWANQKTREMPTYSGSNADLKVLAQKVYSQYSQTAMEETATSVQNAENLALGCTVTGSIPAAAGFPYSNLTDGKLDTIWKAEGDPEQVSFVLDLPGEMSVVEITFSMPQIAGDFPMSYEAEIFSGGNWMHIPVEERRNLLGTVSIPYSGRASRVRLTLRKTDLERKFGIELAELAVYGMLL